MPEAKLNVKLLDVTQNAAALIYAAARQCYSAGFAPDIYGEAASSGKAAAVGDFIKKVVSSGHESPLEHAKFTFAAEGVSRALTHQLVRHRIASYSQQSQRYVKENDFSYVVPPIFRKDAKLFGKFSGTMKNIQESYDELLTLLKKKGVEGEKANQDARFVLPQGVETKIVVTMNCRELLHFFRERCCSRAQWEIRALAEEMLEVCRKNLPEVFAGAGAKCEALKYCPEGPKFTCGKYPIK